MKNCLIGLFLLCSSLTGQAIEPDPKFIKKLDEIRLKSGVHGIAVGVVQGESPAMFFSSGFADTSERTPITGKTQFRLGSVSKMFVALSIMKLVENNSLALDSEIRKLAPEIEFTNPFASEYPLQVIHLLNHSTGWDAMRFAENVPQSSPPISISQALELLPDSRTSRWPPGTRSAYNNTGPLVAAYLVEKISGMRFETFVKQTFLQPLDMLDTDYFYTDNYRAHSATLYLGQKAVPYAHLNNRAAGGVNGSVEDMAKFIRFLNHQGSHSDLLSVESLKTLQNATGTLSAEAGIEVAHLAGFQQFKSNSLTFFGHEGSVRGGSALLVHQPELKVGYVIAVNGEGPAIPPIHQFLTNMLTGKISPHEEQQTRPFNETHSNLAGWYVNISPTSQLVAPFQRLIPWKLTVSLDKAFITPLLGGPPRQLKAGLNGQFLQEKTNKVVALTVNDPLAGRVLHYGPNTLKPVSTPSAILPLMLVILWVLFGFLALTMAIWWVPKNFIKKHSFQNKEKLKTWPLITFSLFPFGLVVLLTSKNSLHIESLLGKPSWLTITIMLTTVLFFLSSFWGLVNWWRIHKLVTKGFVFWHATLLIGLNILMSIYLLSYGLIGIRLWV